MSRTRCVEGRTYRHDPQADDPDLETDIGQCPECDGVGCDELEQRLLAAEYEEALDDAFFNISNPGAFEYGRAADVLERVAQKMRN